MCKIAVDCDASQWHIDCMETAKATTGDTEMQAGDKVMIDGKDKAEVVKVFKNGKVKVSFWVQSFGMVRPELWTETYRPERLSA